MTVEEDFPAPVRLAGAGIAALHLLVWAWHMTHDPERWYRKIAERSARGRLQRRIAGDAERQFAQMWRWRWFDGTSTLAFFVLTLDWFFRALDR